MNSASFVVFLGVAGGGSHQMTEYKRSKRHWTIPTPQHTSEPTMVCATQRNIRFLAQTFAAAMVREKNIFPRSWKILVPAEVGEES